MRIDSPIVSGSFRMSGSGVVSGSWTVTNGITGSLFGTSSWANNASTASFVLQAVSSSFSTFARNGFPFTGSALITGSLGVTGNTSILGNVDIIGTITTTSILGNLIGSGSGVYSNSVTLEVGGSGSLFLNNPLYNSSIHGGLIGHSGNNTFISLGTGRLTSTGLTIIGTNKGFVDNAVFSQVTNEWYFGGGGGGGVNFQRGFYSPSGNGTTLYFNNVENFSIGSGYPGPGGTFVPFLTFTSGSRNIGAQSFSAADGVINQLTASYAMTASFALNAGGAGSGTSISTGSVTASVTPSQFQVTSGSVTELVVTGTGVTIGSAITDIHRVTGSLSVSGSDVSISGSNSVSLRSGVSFLTLFPDSNGARLSYQNFNNVDTTSDRIRFSLGGTNTHIFHGDSNTIFQTIGSGYFGAPNVSSLLTPSARVEIRGVSATTGNALQVRNSTPTNLYTIQNNGQHIIESPVISLSPSQSAYIISQSVSQSATIGAQVYGLNITSRFQNTTASQTQTAFRLQPTFTGSFSGSNTQNIIADFGAANVGTQFSVNDITSGSIYMVNDVSGLPIIEATSDWTVNMYNFPNRIFRKTGSVIELGIQNNTSSSVNMFADVIINEGLGFIHRTTQASGSTVGAVTSSIWTINFGAISSSVYVSAIVTGFDTGSRDTITGDIKATIRYRAGVASIVGINQSFTNADASVGFGILASSTSGSLQVFGTGSRAYQWGATITTQII